MDALEVILTRRSVRSFLQKPVSAEIVDKLLQAAMSAPSARDKRPWSFLVIDDRELLDKIPKVHPHAKMCLQAPMALVLCADAESYKDGDIYWVQALSASTENIMLAARALGLGSVWLGVYPREERIEGLKELFQLPENVTPFNIIPVGYTDILQEAVERYQKDKIHYNKW